MSTVSLTREFIDGKLEFSHVLYAIQDKVGWPTRSRDYYKEAIKAGVYSVFQAKVTEDFEVHLKARLSEKDGIFTGLLEITEHETGKKPRPIRFVKVQFV